MTDTFTVNSRYNVAQVLVPTKCKGSLTKPVLGTYRSKLQFPHLPSSQEAGLAVVKTFPCLRILPVLF